MFGHGHTHSTLVEARNDGDEGMTQEDNLDQLALAAAKKQMGRVAWPTVIFSVTVIIAYLAAVTLTAAGWLPLAAAIPLVAVLTYLAYTTAHEAAHGTISGSRQSMRWLNEALGYAAAWILMIPMTAHRHEHLAHHRNTNDPETDPDFVVSEITHSLASAPRVVARILLGQYRYYFKYRWGKGPRSQDVYLCLEVVAALAPRLALCAAGFWLQGLALFVVAWLIGVAILLYLFAYIVHTPHTATGRYVDTSTILVPGVLGKIVTVLWVYQNYHSIHHLFPRVPFYCYPALFEKIEHTMVARDAPVYRLDFGGMHRMRVVDDLA